MQFLRFQPGGFCELVNQPPWDTVVNDLGGAAAASVVGVLQSGAPFQYRDVSELFM